MTDSLNLITLFHPLYLPLTHLCCPWFVTLPSSSLLSYHCFLITACCFLRITVRVTGRGFGRVTVLIALTAFSHCVLSPRPGSLLGAMLSALLPPFLAMAASLQLPSYPGFCRKGVGRACVLPPIFGFFSLGAKARPIQYSWADSYLHACRDRELAT
jgi:hypothetical protein